MGKFIFDKLTGIPTVLATNRTKRPDQTGSVNTSGVHTLAKDDKEDEKPKVDKQAIFMKGNEHLTPPTLYQDQEDWNVRVFANKFPIVDDHEVVVHSPEKDKDIPELSVEHVVKIIRAYLDRVSYYGSQEKEVMIFNNRGGKAGASIVHPHSQIVALKGFPGNLEKEKSAALRYYNENNSCYWCDAIREEQEYGKRVVFESPHFLLMVPPDCRWSYELSLMPKEHKPNFGFIHEEEIYDFARILRATLRGYDALFDKPDRNFWIHTMRYEPYHWHVGFLPHIKVLGGLEFGAGIWVSDKATPEDAASELGPIVKAAYEEEDDE